MAERFEQQESSCISATTSLFYTAGKRKHFSPPDTSASSYSFIAMFDAVHCLTDRIELYRRRAKLWALSHKQQTLTLYFERHDISSQQPDSRVVHGGGREVSRGPANSMFSPDKEQRAALQQSSNYWQVPEIEREHQCCCWCT